MPHGGHSDHFSEDQGSHTRLTRTTALYLPKVLTLNELAQKIRTLGVDRISLSCPCPSGQSSPFGQHDVRE